jgi:hypothetical protein
VAIAPESTEACTEQVVEYKLLSVQRVYLNFPPSDFSFSVSGPKRHKIEIPPRLLMPLTLGGRALLNTPLIIDHFLRPEAYGSSCVGGESTGEAIPGMSFHESWGKVLKLLCRHDELWRKEVLDFCLHAYSGYK